MKRIMKFFRVIKNHFLLNLSNIFYLFLFLSTSLLLLLVFQNCSSNLNQTPHLFSAQAPNDSGYIIAYLPSEDGSIVAEDQFLIDSNVKLKAMHNHSDSESFKWEITRAFETITDGEVTTTEPEYQYQFTQAGSYDIFAKSYKNSDLLTVASKRIVIGEDCSVTDILEIILESGSLTVGETATFGLKDATNFSNIVWKATLPSLIVINDDNDSESIELDLTNESAGTVTIEVSAEDPNNSTCLTYRKQILELSSASKPHFNPMIIKNNDSEVAVMLENNGIYKYERPESGTWTLHTDIQNANECEFQVDSGSGETLNCGDGVIDIASTAGCVSNAILIKASTTSIDSETSTDIVEQSYYNYCPSEDTYCYFSGPLSGPLDYQSCEASLSSQSDQENTRDLSSVVDGECDNSIENACLQGTLSDTDDSETHYQWQCLGSNGGSDATDCSIAIQTAAVPVNGVCNNSQRNSCSAGTANDAAIADTSTHYTWHCEGSNGGTTATNCQKAKSTPVNGVCNNAQRNSCSSGTSNDAVIADTATHYRWHCVGANGGSTATNCQKTKPVNGVCKNSQRNGCSSGTANDAAITDTTTHYRWHCVGANGGSTATNCQKAKPVNGVCNNSQQNGCSSGTANDLAIADTNTHYRWHCVGANGGSTATNCQKAKPVNGVCNNSQQNGCSSGTATDSAIADTNTHYRWHCVGANGGSTATNCQKAKPVNGVCNNSQQNGCSSGTANDLAIADTNTHYRWHCVGANGGSTATNCQKAKPVNGVCNNTQRNSCSSGTANDAAIVDTTTHYRWHCVGANGGSTATNCQKAKPTPVNGACNNAQRNGCSTGTANDNAIADTNTHYTWHCVGSNGGITATSCQKAKPVNGVCDNSQQNGCSSGTANDDVIADTNTHYTWHCVGTNGGSTATNCQKLIPIDGVCDQNQRNGCSAGTAKASPDNTHSTLYIWVCEGLHGGKNQNCTRLKSIIEGVCDNSQRNSCSSGTVNDAAIDDTDTHYTWLCEGQYGGATATDCQKAKPRADGRCVNGNSYHSPRNTCASGTVNDDAVEDTDTYYGWLCDGINGGRSAICYNQKGR